MHWKVGDRAILVGLIRDARDNGTKVTILSPLMRSHINGEMVHKIDFPPRAGKKYTTAEPKHLRPIPDNGSWQEIEKATEWNPTELCYVDK